MYDARELAEARADYAEAFFTQTVVRLRDDDSDGPTDGGGGLLPAASEPVNYPGRVGTKRQDRRSVEGEQAMTASQTQVEVPFDADIVTGDRLQVDGSTFTVIGTDKGRAEAQSLTADVT